jgi:predicted lipoprotein with Yx(FWY)xxD motif
MSRRLISILGGVAALPLIALAVAACGGGGATAASPQPKAPAPPKPAGTTVSMANNPKLGKILVDSRGDTLYLFKADSRTMSACTGACATAWPPLRSNGKPVAAPMVNASLLGTINRSDGAPQVTYNGHPLYLFSKDTKAGDTNGQGLTAFGSTWFAVSPAGNQVGGQKASSGASASPAPQRPAVTTPAPPATTPTPAPPPATTPAPPPPPPATTPAPPPAAKPAPPANNGIPQNGGGDGDSDNNGGPSDGDGNV